MDNGDGDGQSRFCHDGKDGEKAAGPDSKDIYVQLVISLALGISAFVAFCVSSRQ